MGKIKIKRLLKQDFQLVEQFLTNNFSSPTHWPDWNLVISKYFLCSKWVLELQNC